MPTKVTVIDYKAGNLTSVVKALHHLGADVTVTEDPGVVRSSSRVVLPGVGHFAATRRLDDTGITEAVRSIIANGTPFLGICVGMQWLLEGSTEAPQQPGLGYFNGVCERFPEGTEKVPHVGWDHLAPRIAPPSRLFTGMESGQDQFVYFTHSYYVPENAAVSGSGPSSSENATASVTNYIVPFASAVEHENVMGVQFHPEKSGDAGLTVLTNFLEWTC
jgi:imidazole glycerol-phosphate synthase subunit HisH